MSQTTIAELLVLSIVLLLCLIYLYRYVRRVFNSRRCNDACCSKGDDCLPQPPKEQVIRFEPPRHKE